MFAVTLPADSCATMPHIGDTRYACAMGMCSKHHRHNRSMLYSHVSQSIRWWKKKNRKGREKNTQCSSSSSSSWSVVFVWYNMRIKVILKAYVALCSDCVSVYGFVRFVSLKRGAWTSRNGHNITTTRNPNQKSNFFAEKEKIYFVQHRCRPSRQ